MLTKSQKNHNKNQSIKIKELKKIGLCYCGEKLKKRADEKLYSLCQKHFENMSQNTKNRRKEESEKRIITKNCQFCNVEFTTSNSKKINCSNSCAVESCLKKNKNAKKEVKIMIRKELTNETKQIIKQNIRKQYGEIILLFPNLSKSAIADVGQYVKDQKEVVRKRFNN